MGGGDWFGVTWRRHIEGKNWWRGALRKWGKGLLTGFNPLR